MNEILELDGAPLSLDEISSVAINFRSVGISAGAYQRMKVSRAIVENLIAGGETARVIATYRRLHPGASPARRLAATLTDCNFRIRSLLMAERRVRQGRAPVWMYSACKRPLP